MYPLNPSANPYQALGGGTGVRRLVTLFYDHMDTLEQARGIRLLHPSNLDGAREKLYLFLCGWLGGPPLYQHRFGHPMLRRRHLPFPIGRAERDQWLLFMDRALNDMDLPDTLRLHLLQGFRQVADHMRNRAEPAADGATPPVFVHPQSKRGNQS